jgi:hypothetical protein
MSVFRMARGILAAISIQWLRKVFLLTTALLLHSIAVFANMASPYHEGTWASAPFISSNVDIRKETLLIVPDSRFETARFVVEYFITANKSARQVPLLFFASDFKGGFRVWLDDQKIELSAIPQQYQALVGTPFEDFTYIFEPTADYGDGRTLVENPPFHDRLLKLSDLKFFEANIVEGDHIIRAEYVAEPWVDGSNWIKQYSFRYAL